MRECGQTVVEWLAVLTGVLVLGSAAAVVAPSAAPAIASGMQTQICHVTGGSCDGSAVEPAPAEPAATPAPAEPAATPAPAEPAATPAPATPPATRATPAAPARDLCGSSYFNVPELWFTDACEGHDRCYGAHRGKAACDTAFLNDMLATCAKLPASSGGVNSSLTRASCRAGAHLYYKGVVVGGGFSCHRPVCRDQ